MNDITIGRLLRSSTTGYVFGCSVPEPEVPLFGMFVKAPAQRGQTEVLGLIYNITIQDDPFVRQMIATPDLPETYIQDQRANRQVPLEVSVVAVGYRSGGDYIQALPPQPPITLDRITACSDDEVCQFTKHHDYLRLILDNRDAPADQLIAACIQRASDCQPPQDRDRFRREAGRELAKLLSRDLTRLEILLRHIRP
jgi:hypothetical protein